MMDALIRVRGIQTTKEEEDVLEIVTAGQYLCHEGSHYIRYEELLEGYEEPVKNVIRYDGKRAVVTKKGVIESRMVFEPGAECRTAYATPLGEMPLVMRTRELSFEEEGKKRFLRICYELDINLEPFCVNTIEAEIELKDSENQG